MQRRSSVALPLIWEGATRINPHDIERIKNGAWLTENIIDAFLLSIFPAIKPYPSRRIVLSPIFLELLSKRGPLEVSEWITQSPQFQMNPNPNLDRMFGVNVFTDFDVIVIPYNIENVHWITIIVNFEEKKMQVFDSIQRNSRYKCPFDGQLMRDFLVQEYERIYGEVDWEYFEQWNFEKIELLKPEKITNYQKDDNNCGVWVIAFVNNYLRNLSKEGLSGKKMNSYRNLLAELAECALEQHLEVSPKIVKREFNIGGKEIHQEQEDFPSMDQLVPKLSRTPSVGRLPTLCRQKSISLAEALEVEYKRAKTKRMIIEQNQENIRKKVLEIQTSISELMSMVDGLIPKDIDVQDMDHLDESSIQAKLDSKQESAKRKSREENDSESRKKSKISDHHDHSFQSILEFDVDSIFCLK
jgi:hypothetical protein